MMLVPLPAATTTATSSTQSLSPSPLPSPLPRTSFTVGGLLLDAEYITDRDMFITSSSDLMLTLFDPEVRRLPVVTVALASCHPRIPSALCMAEAMKGDESPTHHSKAPFQLVAFGADAHFYVLVQIPFRLENRYSGTFVGAGWGWGAFQGSADFHVFFGKGIFTS